MLGISLRQLGRSEAEIAAYTKAIAIEPDYHQAIIIERVAMRFNTNSIWQLPL